MCPPRQFLECANGCIRLAHETADVKDLLQTLRATYEPLADRAAAPQKKTQATLSGMFAKAAAAAPMAAPSEE